MMMVHRRMVLVVSVAKAIEGLMGVVGGGVEQTSREAVTVHVENAMDGHCAVCGDAR